MGVSTAMGQLADLAEAQNGLVTTRQADAHDVARRDLTRLVHSGGLERVAHGVYRVGGAPRPRLLELRAAWLQLAPAVPVDSRTPSDGTVSHVSATLVYGVGLLEPFRYEFTIPTRQRVRSRRADVVIYRRPMMPDEVDWVDDLLVTTPARTVADLCSSVLDGDHLAGVVVDLLSRRLITRRDLVAALEPHADRYGYGSGRAFLDHLRRPAS
jgi:predicted transcriptional regulator of viral defense system